MFIYYFFFYKRKYQTDRFYMFIVFFKIYVVNLYFIPLVFLN